MATKSDRSAPWFPAKYEKRDVYAIQALEQGEANAEQQKRALEYIINIICGTYDLSYRPGLDGDRDTAFAEGKRFVGSQIVKLLKINPAMVEDK